MKKFMNKPEKFVDEMLEGILLAYPRQLDHAGHDLRCIIKKTAGNKKKVGLVSGGGSGHLPVFMGYVGEGMLDGCAVGGIFQSPSAEQMFEVTKAVDAGIGVVYIYGNYSGDIINFEMAEEMADMEDIKIKHVLGADDVASAPKGEEKTRRGVAGIFYIFKIAGALADEGADIDAVTAIAEKTSKNVRTMGVALTPCIIPEVGKPSFILADNEMEIGMGIHGEPGIRRGKLIPDDYVVDEMIEAILSDHELSAGDEVSVLVNGLGGTPKEELFIIYRRINQILGKKNITIFNVYSGEYATSMEMAGFSISVLKLDSQLKKYLSKPANTPFFTQIQL